MKEKGYHSLLSDMYKEMPVAVILYNDLGLIIDCNEAACLLFGYTKAEMVSICHRDLVPYKFYEFMKETDLRERPTNNDFLWVIRRHKDGTVFECEHNSKNVAIEGANYCLSIYRRSEFRSKIHTDLLGTVISPDSPMAASTFCVFTWQEIKGELRLIGYNPALDESTQGNIRQYIGCTAHELYEHRGRFDHIDLMYDVYFKKSIVREETFCDFLILDNYRYVDVVSFYVSPDLLIQFAEDVTDRREAISALKQSEERFRSLYMSGPIPVLTWRKIGDAFQLIDYNLAMDSFSNSRIGRLVGISSSVFFHQYPELADDIRQCFKNRTTLSREKNMRFITDEAEKYLSFSCSYVPNEFVLTHINDITEKKRAELDLLSYQKELSRLYEKNISIVEKERQRISQELHDGIGQYLSTIKFSIESVVLDAQKGNELDDLSDQLRSSIDLIKETILEVSRMAMNLRPSILDDLGLIATINWFLRKFGKAYNEISIEKELTVADEEVPQPIKIVMYRILQESMSNIVRHSNASSIKIGLYKTGELLEFIISDNGNGFDVNYFSQNATKGLGIAGMRERVAFSHGKFTIESAVGVGTRIRIIWPLGTTDAMLYSKSNHR